MKPGDKVLCVNDMPGRISRFKWLAIGQIYTISNVSSNGDVLVVGIDGHWDSSRFTPFDTVAIEEEFLQEADINH